MLATVSAHSMVAQPAGWRRAWQRRGVYPDRPDTLDAASATLGTSYLVLLRECSERIAASTACCTTSTTSLAGTGWAP